MGISLSYQQKIESNSTQPSTENSVIQLILKEEHESSATGNTVIEKIEALNESKRFRRQSQRFSGLNGRLAFLKRPALSGYASDKDQFPTVA